MIAEYEKNFSKRKFSKILAIFSICNSIKALFYNLFKNEIKLFKYKKSFYWRLKYLPKY